MERCCVCNHVLTANEVGVCKGCEHQIDLEIGETIPDEVYERMLRGEYQIGSGF